MSECSLSKSDGRIPIGRAWQGESRLARQESLGKATTHCQGQPNLAKRTVTSVALRLRQLSTAVDDAPMLSTDSSSGIDLSRPDGTLNPMIITHAELLATGMSAASVRHH